LSGTIDEVNPALANQPELVNTDPYGEGWMIKMTVQDPSQIEKLMSAEAYQQLVG
jgi:glycine cleavage system H protein